VLVISPIESLLPVYLYYPLYPVFQLGSIPLQNVLVDLDPNSSFFQNDLLSPQVLFSLDSSLNNLFPIDSFFLIHFLAIVILDHLSLQLHHLLQLFIMA
jgi:hypothetical protein